MHDPGRIPVYVFHPDPRAEASEAKQGDQGAREFYLPLALGLIVERARALDVEGRFDFDVPLVSSRAALLEAVRARGPGIALFSNYVWSVEANLAASAALKAAEPRALSMHGGPSTPKFPAASEAFLRLHRDVDVAVRGEGEESTAAVLRAVGDAFHGPRAGWAEALRAVEGIAFLDERGAHVRTGDRALKKDLDALPSPYLTGLFDRILADRAAIATRGRALEHATIESNRGCPYGCTFCDWGSATLQKIRVFDLARVRAEVDWIGRHGVRDVFIADANVGILPRDVELAEIFADAKRTYGFPRSLALNYTKNGSTHLRRIFEVWQSAGIDFEATISIQTTDETTLAALNRSNIKTKRYVELSDLYRKMKLPVRRQLMAGLPGQTVESWKADLQIVFDSDESAQLFATRLLPNSPMADPEYVARHRIRVDESESIVETSSFTEDDWRLMHRIGIAFLLDHNWGVLRHVLLYLQLDHGVRAIDFVHAHAEAVRSAPERHPEAFALLGAALDTPPIRAPRADHVSVLHERGWRPFLDEVMAFATERYGIARDSAAEVALGVQEAVLPRRGAQGVRTLPLEHDFAAYLHAGRAALRAGDIATRKPLREHGPGTLRVTHPREHERALHDLPDLWSSHRGLLLASSLDEPSSA